MKTSIDKQHLEERIKDVDYLVLPGTTVTICSITMVNGFSVRGESACVDPKNFDEAKGRKYAYEDAFGKLWQLEGYLLADKLAKKKPECFKLRVLNERDDLAIKLYGLETFREMESFKVLSEDQQRLLKNQAVLMREYLDVLQDRIKLFDSAVA
jgi:hypothetical protein